MPMTDYNHEQLEAVVLVADYIETLAPSELGRLKRRIDHYLKFRKETARFLDNHFAEICTQKCYEDHYSACCSKEGITTFFADVVINGLVSTREEMNRLVHVLSVPNTGMKCVYLGENGCLWHVKPIVCEMFLCDHAKRAVFDRNPAALSQWDRLRKREKRYTWPSRPVLFDELEAYFMDAGHHSSLMYLHNSPGLLRIKRLAGSGKRAPSGQAGDAS